MNKLIAGAVISVGLAVAAVAVAQTQSASDAQSRYRHHHEQRAFSTPGERVEARLAYLKTALKITPAQQPQWDKFADTLRQQANEQDKRIEDWRAQRGQDGDRQRPNAIERLERREKFYTAALEDLRQRIAAAKPLYAVLTPEQQQIADEVFAARHGRGKFGHHDMHRQA